MDGMRGSISSKKMLTHRGSAFFSCYTPEELIKNTKEEENEICIRIRLILIIY